MNEKTIKRLQEIPRVLVENGITYYIISQEEYERLKAKEQECEDLKRKYNENLTVQKQLQEWQDEDLRQIKDLK